MQQRRTWSVSAASVELGADRRTVSKLLEGVEPVGRGSRGEPAYHLAPIVTRLVQCAVEAEASRWRPIVAELEEQLKTDPAKLDPQAERARLDRARAELAEHQLGERRGEFASLIDIEYAWIAAYSATQQRMLGVGNAVAVDCAASSEPPVCQELVDVEIRRALEAITNTKITETKGRHGRELSKLLAEFRQRVHELLAEHEGET